MFGLFDTPFVKIEKHLPAGIDRELAKIRNAADDLTPVNLSNTDRELVIGFVTAAWALGNYAHGKIELSNYNGRYISNMGSNCASMLKDKQYIATAIVSDLIDEGLILPN